MDASGYSQLSQSDLQRLVADSLGYRVEVKQAGRLTRYTLISHEGFVLHADYNEQSAWDHLPQWTTDPSLALLLLISMDFTVAHYAGQGWVITIGDKIVYSTGDLARGLCIVWLLANDARMQKIIPFSQLLQK